MATGSFVNMFAIEHSNEQGCCFGRSRGACVTRSAGSGKIMLRDAGGSLGNLGSASW